MVVRRGKGDRAPSDGGAEALPDHADLAQPPSVPAGQTEEPLDDLMAQIADGSAPWQEIDNLDRIMRHVAGILKKLETRMQQSGSRTAAQDMRQYWAILQSMRKVAAEERQTQRSGVEKLCDQSWIDTQARDIADAEKHLDAVDGLSDAKKKRIRSLLHRVTRCHQRARSSRLHYWAFVGRDQEEAKRLNMAPLHKRFMDALCSPKRGVLLMAHPETAKTMTTVGWVTGELAINPRLRVAYISNQDDRAHRAVAQMRKIIRSAPFRALYPEIRVLPSSAVDGVQNNRQRFALDVGDTTAREYSVQGMAWSANIQGDRFDIIICDDICGPEVKVQPTLRNNINDKYFNVIERRASQAGRRIRFPCTPWHDEDTAGLIDKMHDEGRLRDWDVVKIAIEDDANGRAIPIWPEAYDSEYYEALKRTPTVDYARLYQLNSRPKGERLVQSVRFYPASPTDPSGPRIPKGAWTRCLEGMETLRQAEQWLCFDLASTSASHSSRSWATQIALRSDGVAYVRKAWDMPGDPLEARRFALRAITGEGLFETRYVWTDAEREDDEDTKLRKRTLSRDKVEAQGGIAVLLYEETGGQKLGTIQFADYIREKLNEMGILWRGRYYPFRAQIGGRGILLGKTARLESTAAHFREGSILFPGIVRVDAYKNMFTFCADPNNEVMVRLVGQVLNPAGTLDGLDCLTSFLMANATKLRRELPAGRALDPERKSFHGISARIGDHIGSLWNNESRPQTAMQEEDEWLQASA